MGLTVDIARDLLEIKAVQIRTDNYFTWTSGLRSPIYCDNRLTMSYPKIRKKIMQAFVDIVRKQNIMPDVIAGCATAGISHAAWLANELDLPMVYVRSSPKGHGKGNQIEGHIEAGQNVVVIEDLISTGGSAIDVAKVLEQAGAVVLNVLAIFTYGLSKSVNRFKEADLPYETITNYDELLTVLQTDGQITPDEKIELQTWRNNIT